MRKTGYRIKGLGFSKDRVTQKASVLILTTISYILIPNPCFYALQTPQGGFAGEYLMTFSASGRALGMGKAYNALSDDAAAPYTNPAGLPSIISDEVGLLYVRLFGDSAFSYLGYVHPFSRKHSLAIGRVSLESGAGEKVTLFNEPQGSFQDKQSAYFFSYGRRVISTSGTGGLDLGVSLKIVTQDFDNEYSLGYGLDAGTIFSPGFKTQEKSLFNGMRFGLALQNIVAPSLGRDKFPGNLRFGVVIEGIRKKLLLSSDANVINFTGSAGKTSVMRWHAGLEFRLSKMLSLRGGMDYKELSFGLGFIAKNFQVDYGVAVHTLETTHRVGLTGRFGIPLTEEELRVQEERQKLERSKEAYSKMMEALKSYREKDFVSAKKSLNRVLELEPENEQAKALLGEVSLTLGKEEAQSALVGAQEDYNKMKYEESLIKAKKVLEYEPDNNKAAIIYHLSQAQIYVDDEKYEQAREELITVLKLDVTNEDAKIMLKRVEEALKFLK